MADDTVDHIPTGERAERKRSAIVHAAREVFLREGFDASMDLIAAQAGVSKVTIYNHFRDKETLFTAVIGQALDDALGAALGMVESRLGASAQVREDLLEVCRAWVGGLADPRVLALRNLVAGELRRFPELGDFWQERGPRRFHATIGHALRALMGHGELDIPDVELAVLQLSGLVLSPHLVYGMYGEPPEHGLAERLIVSGVDMFLGYYRPSAVGQPPPVSGTESC
jgi:TetR/AcrR family transcriptional regulator, mexJK operon transcriptional repressor